MGGPDEQHLPGLMLHGVADLHGSVELAGGSGIYVGGVEAAVKRVLEGSCKAEDFRFFIGRKIFAPGFLDSYCR